MSDFPPLSSDIEFALVRFHLELQERFSLGPAEILGLRRDLWNAARQVLGDRGDERFASLFEPPLSEDPVALRRFQRPGPPFALLPEPSHAGVYDLGDRYVLRVSFWGQGIQKAGDFARVLQRLGELGLHHGQGRFELVAIDAETAAGECIPVWSEGQGVDSLVLPINDLSWWLGRSFPPSAVCLEFITPARLLSQGRPLFGGDFRRIFPFILRRVTSMLYAHCGREVLDDPSPLLAASALVRETQNHLRWQDWRTLGGAEQAQDLGGLRGSVKLEGDALKVLDWILRVGSLMNVGKGASFGAGRFLLREPSP